MFRQFLLRLGVLGVTAGLEITEQQVEHHLAVASYREDKGSPTHECDWKVDHFVDNRTCSVCVIIEDRCFN